MDGLFDSMSILGAFSNFLFVAVLCLVIYGVILWGRNNKAGDHRRLAGELGLNFKRSGVGDTGVMHGVYRGVRVEVREVMRDGFKHEEPYIRVNIALGAGVPDKLVLAHETDLDQLGKIFGLQDINVGHPGLDSMLVVKGDDADQVKDYLTRPGIAEAVADFFERYADAWIEKGTLCVERRGELDEATIGFILDRVIDFVEVLRGDKPASPSGADDPYADAHRAVEAELARRRDSSK